MNRKLKTRKQVSDGDSFQEFCPRHSNENLTQYLLAPNSPTDCDKNWLRQTGSSRGTAGD
jgi:hypothetical protein